MPILNLIQDRPMEHHHAGFITTPLPVTLDAHFSHSSDFSGS